MSNAGKWINIGVSNKDRMRLTSNSRIKAYTVLKNRHKREYLLILKKILKKEYRFLKEKTK